MNLRSWLRQVRLDRATHALEEEAYDLDNWSFGDRPSEERARDARIKRLALKVYLLDGDPYDFRFRRDRWGRYTRLVDEALGAADEEGSET